MVNLSKVRSLNNSSFFIQYHVFDFIFTTGMDVLFKALHKEYDIIILSAGYDDMIKLFLARHGLLNLVSKVFATPTTIASKIHTFRKKYLILKSLG